MHNILITGGAGFIGRQLTKRLLSLNEYKVTVVDNLSSNNRKYFDLDLGSEERTSFYNEDMRNKDSISDILKMQGISSCIHLAAKVSVSDSIINPDETMDVNVRGTLNVLEACSRNSVKNFVFASSAAVYGEPQKLPLSEHDMLEPLSPYGASKVAGEALVSSYRNSKKIKNAVSLRFFNVYGEGQTSEYAGVITKFMERLSRKLPPIIYGDGEQKRDFISINDVVNAILLVATADRSEGLMSTRSTIFNIGTGKPTMIKDLAQLMISSYELDLEPVFVEARKGDIITSYADTRKSKLELGFTACDELGLALRKIKA